MTGPTPRRLPLAGPVARAIYRPMQLWCDVGRHVEPRTHACAGCAQRVCPRHSRWQAPRFAADPPARGRRLCDDCLRKEPPDARQAG